MTTTSVSPAAGLSSAEAASRLAAGQGNDVSRRTSRSIAEILRANLITRFNILLGVMAVIVLVTGQARNALFGLAVVVNTAVGVIQEIRAKRTLDRLSLIGQARPHVFRDGVVIEVGLSEVVLGDVVEARLGDTVCVDGQVLAELDGQSLGLEVHESLLTGEADPVAKEPGDQVLSGSFVVAGSGRFEATRVGAHSFAAKLAGEASTFSLVGSELRSGIDRFMRVVQWLMIPVGALLIVSQVQADLPLPEAISGTVAGLVTMVPEGLVLLMSMAFAIGVIRLGRRNCLVNELPAIEGLARVDVVCLDKTGTLTEPGMVVDRVVPIPRDAADPGGADQVAATAELELPELTELLGALAAADPHPNPSLAALAAYAPDPGWGAPAQVMAFSSARKWSGVDFGARGKFVLGAPDVLAPETSTALHQANALAQAAELEDQGLRVLLVARVVTGDAQDSWRPLLPLALVVIRQQERADAAATLAYFAAQGVAVKIISGDNHRTVAAVAARLGLAGASDAVDARTLPQDDTVALGAALEGGTVFGRVTPQFKRTMVHALQLRGHVVAMTGDGVNDALALKDADIGVAMGSGSDASKAVARIVLLDDRFASLPSVVAEGRRVIANIERVANLFLTKTVYALCLAFLTGIAPKLPYPFEPIHLTLVAALTIGIPSFFLALAPSTERARTGFVPRVLRFAIPCGIVAALATFTAYALARNTGASTLRQDQSTALLTLFVVTMGVLAFVSHPWTLWRVTMVVTMVMTFVLVIAVPALQSFFLLDFTELDDNLYGVAIGLAGFAALWGFLRWRDWLPGSSS